MSSTAISDPTIVESTLRQWSTDALLQTAVTLSDDGTVLQRANDDSTTTALDATVKLTVSSGDRSCVYSTAAIFLQIRNVDQGLVVYRAACKKHGVKDSIKALDKQLIVGSFVPSAAAAVDAEAPATAAAPAASEEVRADQTEDMADRQRRKEHHSSSSASKRKHESSSSGSKHRSKSGSSSSRHHQPPKPKKPKPGMVTTEQLLEHLTVVVDKRDTSSSGIGGGGADGGNTADGSSAVPTATSRMERTVTAALSAKGFEVSNTAALSQEHRDRTKAILARETPVGNSASILRANNPRKDLSHVLKLFMDTVQPPGSSKHGKKASLSSSKSPSSNNNGRVSKPHLIGKRPIIVVPKGMTAPITLINAHQFLCHAKYTPRDQLLRQRSGGNNNKPETTFTRTLQHQQGDLLLEYEIMDNPRSKLTSSRDWDRIVAVLVLGQAWQFKDWLSPGYNTPATLFQNVYGCYVGMEGDKVPAAVSTWAVSHTKLNRDKRGLDSVTYASFWNGLDEWMKVYKAELLPQGGNEN